MQRNGVGARLGPWVPPMWESVEERSAMSATFVPKSVWFQNGDVWIAVRVMGERKVCGSVPRVWSAASSVWFAIGNDRLQKCGLQRKRVGLSARDERRLLTWQWFGFVRFRSKQAIGSVYADDPLTCGGSIS